MSEKKGQVSIVSAFGRGYWLAAQLVREGLDVHLIDVSSQLGIWPAEDIEGPFGFFRHEGYSSSQVDRILSEEPYQELSNGFTCLLPQGPIEFKSPLTKFYLEKMGLDPSKQKTLLPGQKVNLTEVAKEEFAANWLVGFASQWASTTYRENRRSIGRGESALPLLSSFWVRSLTRQSADASHRWLSQAGVSVFKQTEIMDLSFDGKNISGLELQGDRQGLFKVDQLVWALTSEETYFLNSKIGEKIFTKGALESEWSWVRYRCQFDSCAEREQLPLHMVWIKDPIAPWSHENLMTLQRTALADQFDVWIRIPTVQRFNKDYLRLRGEKVLQVISERWSQINPSILVYPQEFNYTYKQLGAPRYPVFSDQQSARRGYVQSPNLHWSTPEVWNNYSWEVQLQGEEDLRVKLVQWWQKKLAKEKGKEA